MDMEPIIYQQHAFFLREFHPKMVERLRNLANTKLGTLETLSVPVEEVEKKMWAEKKKV